MARFHLTKAKGERKPGEICRHMCKNDSYVQKRPDGFVCCNPDHIKWGTYYENRMDQSPEARAASGKAAALTDGPSRGGKMPTAGGNLQRTCVHCGRTMSAAMHGRWHGDRCKHKLISALIIDDCYAQLNLIYDS